MLVVVPLGLLVTGVVFDIVAMVSGSVNARIVAFYDIGVGILAALLAVIPGVIDYLTLKGDAARVGTWHMVLNLGALTFFTVSWFARTRWGAGVVGIDSPLPMVTGLLGLAVLAPAGWLGGALVYEHGMGVAPATRVGGRSGRRAA